jgi:cell division topological specificity factor
MGWLDRVLGREAKSSAVAKKRLQMVLIHDRSDISPGLLEQIKDDIIGVIAQHLAIDRDHVVVNIDQTTHQNRLVAEVPLAPINGRVRKQA